MHEQKSDPEVSRREISAGGRFRPGTGLNAGRWRWRPRLPRPTRPRCWRRFPRCTRPTSSACRTGSRCPRSRRRTATTRRARSTWRSSRAMPASPAWRSSRPPASRASSGASTPARARRSAIYFMYDVKQFVPEEWSSPPLEGRLVQKEGLGTVCMGRGAVNQKGPENSFLSALMAFQGRRQEAAGESGAGVRGRGGDRLAAFPRGGADPEGARRS